MAIVNGNIKTLTGANTSLGRIWFRLASPDWDADGNIYAPQYVEALADTEDGSFSVDLVESDSLSVDQPYLAVLLYRDAVSGRDMEYKLSTFRVPTGGPHELSDLLADPVVVPVPADLLQKIEQAVAATAEDADRAETAADRVDLGALDAAVEATAADRVATGQDRAATAADALAAEAARDTAETFIGVDHVAATWTALAAISGTTGQTGYVDPSDTGTHTDPITSAVVPNEGRYTWAADGLGSAQAQRIASTGLAVVNAQLAEIEDAVLIYDGEGPIIPIATDDASAPVLWYDKDKASVVGIGLPSAEATEAVEDGLAVYGGDGPKHPLVGVDIRGVAMLEYDEDTEQFTGPLIDAARAEILITAPLVDLPVQADYGAKVALFDYGQSNRAGADAVLIGAAQPYGNKMFNGGTLPGSLFGQADMTASLYTSLVAMVEETVETAVSAQANYARAFAALQFGENPSAVSIFGATFAKSGERIDALSKGDVSGLYDDRLIVGVDRLNTLDTGYKVLALCHTEGETAAANLYSGATYKTLIKALADDFEADVQTITGQTAPVYTLITQTTEATAVYSEIAMAQLEAAQEHDRIFLVGPMYMMDFATLRHLSGVGQNQHGARTGRAAEYLRRGKVPPALSPVSATAHGLTVTARFAVPTLPLVFDTDTVPLTEDYGFRITDDDGDITISSFAIRGATVEFTINRALAANPQLRYALDYIGPGMPNASANGASGNLRDSTPDPVWIDGDKYTLPYWAPHYLMPIYSV